MAQRQLKRATRDRNSGLRPAEAARVSGWEWFGFFVLIGLVAYFLHVSWRKWPDPLIDFGRELYIAWRLSEGAVLQRDVEDFYGPLSQYLNALVFRAFGPGLMVLVTANLIVFGGILALAYALLRRGWGAGAAWTGAAVFVSVFAFSQHVGISNYNFATPYVHATTHGLLVVLALTLVLARWVERASVLRSLAAGLLLGLTAVLKPEFMMSGALVTFAAVFIRFRLERWPTPRAALAWATGAIVPTAVFWLEFARNMTWSDAFLAAGKAWINVVTTARYSGDPSQLEFLGFANARENLAQHAIAIGWAVLVLAVLCAGGHLVDRTSRRWLRAAAAAAVVAGLGWASSAWIDWIFVGRALLGLSLAYGVVGGLAILRARSPDPTRAADVVRVLFACLAISLMARMLLNGRIFQFGFYQAAPAGVLVAAVMVGELPQWFAKGRFARAVILAGTFALLIPGSLQLARRSESFYARKTQPVGTGVDRFYAFPTKMDPTAALVDVVSESLSKDAAGETVLVLPAGTMINYLARRRSPVRGTVFFAGTLAEGGEAQVVEELAQNPPNRIVLISLDLRDFGVQRYGEAVGKGASIMAWIDERYVTATALGKDPLDTRQRGARILKPK